MYSGPSSEQTEAAGIFFKDSSVLSSDDFEGEMAGILMLALN
jgi:hypothetical protein